MTVDNLLEKKCIVGVTLFVAFFLVVPFWACKGEEIPSTRLITPDLKSEVDLTKDYNSILDYEETNICIEEDTTNLTCVKSQPVIKYLYISDRPVMFEENEDYFAITKNTRTYLAPDGQRSVRVYGSDAFIEVEGTWYETEFGFTTPEVWNKASTGSLTYLDKWNPFKVYHVNAQETLYAGSGDAYFNNDVVGNWANCHAGVGNTILWAANAEGNIYCDQTVVRKVSLPFDTSSLDGTVDSANLVLTTPQNNAACNDTNVDFGVIQGSATNTSAIYTTAFAPASFDRLSADKTCATLNALSANATFTYALNASGTAIIDVDGVTALEIATDNYVDNTTYCSNSSHIDIYMSEQSGTTYDPYLEITLEEEEEPEEEEATTTIGLLYPENMCINNDLSIICGMTQHYESTTTLPDWVEYHYFHIPWFIWVIITTVTLWIGNRLLIEFLIRWRQ